MFTIDAAPIRLHCHVSVDVHHGETNRGGGSIKCLCTVPWLFGRLYEAHVSVEAERRNVTCMGRDTFVMCVLKLMREKHRLFILSVDILHEFCLLGCLSSMFSVYRIAVIFGGQIFRVQQYL